MQKFNLSVSGLSIALAMALAVWEVLSFSSGGKVFMGGLSRTN